MVQIEVEYILSLGSINVSLLYCKKLMMKKLTSTLITPQKIK